MVPILTIPTEILRLCLSTLADIDLRSFFAARRTCKTFQALITDILEKSITDHGLAIHAFLKSHLSTFLDSSAPTAQPLRYRGEYDSFAPIRALPWVADPATREKWLRPEASWLRLPLTSETGHAVRQLQVICMMQGDLREMTEEDGYIFGGVMDFMPNDYNQNSVVLGGFYNTVAQNQYGDSPPVKGWKVLFGVRVKDYDAFEALCRHCPWRGSSLPKAVQDLLVGDQEWAVLVQYVGHIIWDRSTEGDQIWYPTHFAEYDSTLGNMRNM